MKNLFWIILLLCATYSLNNFYNWQMTYSIGELNSSTQRQLLLMQLYPYQEESKKPKEKNI